MRKRFWKGLRTIDLAIGVFIICMVLAIVAARYDDFKCRAMQSEAKFSLQEVYAAQKQYFAEHDRYASIEQLVKKEGRLVVPEKYYILSDHIKPTQLTFAVVARGAPDTLVSGEIWTIDQEKELTLQKAVCKK